MWKFYCKKIYKIEYWPFYVLYFPFIPLYLYYSLKNKSLIYFTAANPGLHYGGLFNYSKSKINQQIPKKYRLKELKSIDEEHFPFIAKPNKGERGKQVFLIESKEDLNKINNINGEVFYQEYDNSSLEFAVFYCQIPTKKAKIISVTAKAFLSFKGDGIQSLKDFILKNEKAFYARKKLRKLYHNQLNLVLDKGQKLILEKIGNHNRGTTFLDGNHYFSKALEKSIQEVAQSIDGFYYGRLDVKAQSIENFRKGEFKVIEVNGVNSEPTHIYDPNYSALKIYTEIYKHLCIQEKIANKNIQNGFKLPSVYKFIKDLFFYLLKK